MFDPPYWTTSPRNLMKVDWDLNLKALSIAIRDAAKAVKTDDGVGEVGICAHAESDGEGEVCEGTHDDKVDDGGGSSGDD